MSHFLRQIIAFCVPFSAFIASLQQPTKKSGKRLGWCIFTCRFLFTKALYLPGNVRRRS
ncbi:hypothetical protein SPAB_04641 [Salmonella enterica subsp. enterica serovar Paratyphi B str. SPB7]|uniref:Uncharacterized protein n=1 Tax=Salmonella paratyphi B (strain ATCC BAA-1250 / SPB7) TaxID=1016998 RepID=A0A6C6Z8J7_SALPB|nr:hypothetical protein SPAB_04641 [Salmonella enterica subsp. enterica serovar Paratyphi B str. SPB7]